jgi:hypothetical protein
MLMSPSFACGVSCSIMGQPWRWRGAEADDDSGFRPDALIDQILLARGVARADLEQHRQPTLRGFMPNPSVFRDMEKAAARSPTHSRRARRSPSSAITTSTAPPRRPCWSACCGSWAARRRPTFPTG